MFLHQRVLKQSYKLLTVTWQFLLAISFLITLFHCHVDKCRRQANKQKDIFTAENEKLGSSEMKYTSLLKEKNKKQNKNKSNCATAKFKSREKLICGILIEHGTSADFVSYLYLYHNVSFV